MIVLAIVYMIMMIRTIAIYLLYNKKLTIYCEITLEIFFYFVKFL